MGPLPEGPVALLPADQGGFRDLDRSVQGGDRARPRAFDRARLSRHDPWCRACNLAGSRAPGIVDRGDEPCRKQRPARSPFLLRVFASVLSCTRWRAITRPRMEAAKGGRAEPLRHGRARRARDLPSRDRRAPAGDRAVFDGGAARQQRPAISMGGLERIQPLSVRQYDASLSWAREALYLNPNHLQVLAVRAAALAQSGEARKPQAPRSPAGNFPTSPSSGTCGISAGKTRTTSLIIREGLLKAGASTVSDVPRRRNS